MLLSIAAATLNRVLPRAASPSSIGRTMSTGANYVFSNPYANAPAPTPAEIEVIKSTVPVLAEHGVTLTTMFYKKMLGRHPELKSVFNHAHQATGMQPKALATAVYAYAANIENLTPLLPAVSLMAHKHVSLSILPSQYPIVGTNLLETLKELLLSAKFPEETVAAVISAWASAYGQLANILITEEEKLYKAAEAAPGGWRGWREFVIERKEMEAESGIASFYLVPKDGGDVPPHIPGQFTTVRINVPGVNGEPSYYQPRQYTLSAPANGKQFRITVKREDAASCPATGAAASASSSGCPFMKKETAPAGVVSNIMHQQCVGNVVELAPPFGDFVLHQAKSPVVVLAAGVGITPMVSIVEGALEQGRPVSFIYGCHSGAHHPMRSWLDAHKASPAAKDNRFASRVFYSHPTATNVAGTHYDAAGRVNAATLDADLLRLASPDTDYYLCGPGPFMRDVIAQLKERGVSGKKIHAEAFGSEGLTTGLSA